MIKISVQVELDIKQAKQLIKRMPTQDKIQLLRELRKETWVKRMDEIQRNIDQRRKKVKMSDKEISQEIEKARKEFYEGRH